MLSSSGIAALLRYGPWAVMAALALSLGVITALWYSQGRALRASEQLASARAGQIDRLNAEVARRDLADLARLAASGQFQVKVEGYHDRTTILMREIVRFVPDDRPCLSGAAVEALNDGRWGN
jgi:hypothetical protein